MEALIAQGATAGFSAAFAGGNALTAMQGGATALSALSSLSAGRAAKRAGRASAQESFLAAGLARQDAAASAFDIELQGEQEFRVARFRAARLKEDVNDTIGQQRVAFAASGVSASDGTAARLQEQTARRGREDAAIEIASGKVSQASARIKAGNVRRRGDFEASSYTRRGEQFLAQGSAEERGMQLDALGRIFNFAADVKKRG